MSAQLKSMVRKVYQEAYNKGNLSVLDDVIDANYVRHHPPMKKVEGLAAYRQFITDIRAGYSDFEIRIDDIMAEDNKTVARITLTGKHTGKIPTLQTPPTGKTISMQGCIVTTWANDKIVEEWAYNDYMGLTQQFGVVPLMIGGFE